MRDLLSLMRWPLGLVSTLNRLEIRRSVGEESWKVTVKKVEKRYGEGATISRRSWTAARPEKLSTPRKCVDFKCIRTPRVLWLKKGNWIRVSRCSRKFVDRLRLPFFILKKERQKKIKVRRKAKNPCDRKKV